MRYLLVACLLAALTATGCGPSATSVPGGAPPEMGRILDAARSATKATEVDKTRWYTPESLHELIDGMDQYFIESGFRHLAQAELKAPGAKADAYVELGLYDMGAAEGALRILADLRGEKTPYLGIGNEAHQADLGIDLRVGRYYVKLVARPGLEGQERFVQALAEAVAKAAPPGPADDPLVAPLPGGTVPHTAAWTPARFLGLDFLKVPVREAAYDLHGQRVRLFAGDCGDEAKAQALFKQWKESVGASPGAGAAGADSFAYKDPYAGNVLVICRGRHLLGAIGDAQVATPLLDGIVKSER